MAIYIQIFPLYHPMNSSYDEKSTSTYLISSTFGESANMLPLIFLAAFLLSLAKASLKYKGADVSSILKLEKEGVKFKTTSGTIAPFESILGQSGAIGVHQRI